MALAPGRSRPRRSVPCRLPLCRWCPCQAPTGAPGQHGEPTSRAATIARTRPPPASAASAGRPVAAGGGRQRRLSRRAGQRPAAAAGAPDPCLPGRILPGHGYRVRRGQGRRVPATAHRHRVLRQHRAGAGRGQAGPAGSPSSAARLSRRAAALGSRCAGSAARHWRRMAIIGGGTPGNVVDRLAVQGQDRRHAGRSAAPAGNRGGRPAIRAYKVAASE